MEPPRRRREGRRRWGGAAQELLAPVLTATRATAGIALSTAYGAPLSIAGGKGGNKLEKGELPLLTLELVYRWVTLCAVLSCLPAPCN